MLKKLSLALVGLVVGIIILTLLVIEFAARPLINWQLEPMQLQLGERTEFEFNPVHFSLEVKNLSVLHNTTELVAFDRLFTNINPSKLYFDTAEIELVEFSGLKIDVKQKDGNWLINNVDVLALLPKTTDEPNTNEQSPEKSTENGPEETSEASKPLQVLLNRLHISDAHIKFEQDGLKTSPVINDLEVNNLVYTPETLNAEMALDLALNLALFDPNQATIATIDNHIQFDTEIAMKTSAQSNTIDIEALDLILSENVVNAAGYDVALKRLAIELSDIALAQSAEEVALNHQFNINLEDLNVKPTDAQGDVQTATLSRLNFANGAVSLVQPSDSTANSTASPVPKLQLNLESLNLQQLLLMSSDEKTPPLAQLDALTVEQISASPERLSIDAILIGKLLASATLQADNTLTPLYLAKTSSTETTETTSAINETTPNEKGVKTDQNSETSAGKKAQNKTGKKSQKTSQKHSQTAHKEESDSKVNPPKASAPVIVLNRLSLTAPAELRFRDQSVSPAFNTPIVINTLEVEQFVSDQNLSTQDMPWLLAKVDANIGEYGKANVDSKLKIKEKISGDINIDVKEIDLPPVSPYLSDALGYVINSGVIDYKANVKLNENKLKGDSTTWLKTMNLTAIDNKGKQSSLSGGAVSFNYALGMLKDDEDVVELDIPIKGDLDKPSVGLSGILALVVKRATMSAAKDYLMTTFVPYSKVVKIALSASNYLLKMEFEPVIFRPTVIELEQNNTEYLQQLVEVLKKYKDIKIKLCPISTLADLTEADKALDEKQQTARLLEMAKLRGDGLKRFLVNEKGIPSERLFSCAGDVDDDEEHSSRIEIEQI